MFRACEDCINPLIRSRDVILSSGSCIATLYYNPLVTTIGLPEKTVTASSSVSTKSLFYRSKVISKLRQSKHEFFQNLNNSSDKAFWKAIRQLNKKESQIPTLVSGTTTATSDREKAELLNNQFSSYFNLRSRPPHYPWATSHPPSKRVFWQ